MFLGQKSAKTTKDVFGQIIGGMLWWGEKPSVVSVLISVWRPKNSNSQSTNFEARKNHSDLIFCFALLLGSKLEGEAASHFNAAREKHGGNHFRLTRKMVRKEEEEQTENCHVWKETKKGRSSSGDVCLSASPLFPPSGKNPV